MKKEEIIEQLKTLKGDPECDHSEADDLLLKFIGDKEITEAFENVTKWYA